MTQVFNIYCDESRHLEHDRQKVMVLGDVWCPLEKIAIHRQVDTTDEQIDQLVYELYGLTDEEIGIVEEGTK